MIPCITSKSINLLYGTADERYSFSKEFFRKTHFPQTLNRYYKTNLIESLSDKELLKELVEDHLCGNRVFFIFGSTGSGKSELLCWIRDQWEIENYTRPIIRISRSELNPQVLIKKCYNTLGFDSGSVMIDENKWDLLLNKPITIINQIVWSTMSELYENDEEIVPAAMLLRPIIEKNILEFTKQVIKGKIIRPLELITKAEFDKLLESTSLKMDIHFKKFRQTLIKKLDEFLFQGTDIGTIFKQMSVMLKENNIRPVLLIDDLVQSMNLYAAELLDYFITLEEGNWDVVIGLTPGVEQEHDFDNELKNRIKNLDTIDDRVKKLWLSDESGSNFFTLDREQTNQYLSKYISALKEANGFICSEKCSNASSCKELLSDDQFDLRLLPFNIPLTNRIYDGIPSGKGTLRYLILHSREVLKFLTKGDTNHYMKINHYIKREIFVQCDEPLIKLISEMYADPNQKDYTLTSAFLKHFKYECSDITVNVQKLEYDCVLPVDDDTKDDVKPSFNNHIRDWIEGKKVKEELLEPVRSGAATIVHEIVKGTYINRSFTSRATKLQAVIQRAEVVNRHKYPITFTEKGLSQISIEKNINLFQIANFQQLKMQERGDKFAKIANDFNVSKWVYQTDYLKKTWINELEGTLGFTIEQFAFFLKQFFQKVAKLGESEWTSSISNPVKKEWVDLSEELFLDWYSLRDNIIDFNNIEVINSAKYNDFDQYILSFIPSKALNKFQIKNYPLQSFIIEMQKEINRYIDCLLPIADEKVKELKHFTNFISGCTSSKYHTLINEINNVIQKDKISLENLIEIDEFIEVFSNDEVKNEVMKNQYEETLLLNMKMFMSFIKEKDEVMKTIENAKEMDEYLKTHLNVRSQVRKYLLKLMENGETVLPKRQWKGILRDMEDVNPEYINQIRVNLSLK